MKSRLIVSLTRRGDGRLVVTLVCGHGFVSPLLLEPTYEQIAATHDARIICSVCPGRLPDEVAAPLGGEGRAP